MRKENLGRGALFILLAATAYACMGGVVKYCRPYSTNSELVFIRNFLCLIFVLPWILLPRPKPLKTEILGVHFIRAGAGLLNMYCFFFSIRYILLTDAMLLNNTMPLFVPLVMWIWKREKISPRLIPALLVGFLGIVILLRPSPEIFQLGSLLALASGILMSISMAGVRELSAQEPTYRIMFYYFAIGTIVSLFPILFAFPLPSGTILLAWFFIGLFAYAYQHFLTLGFEAAPASKVSPFIYFAVILSGLIDWIFWHKVPDLISFVGVPLVIVGAVWAARKERPS